MSRLDMMFAIYEDDNLLIADGLDGAILGVAEQRIVYSKSKCVKVMMKANKWTEPEAMEWLEYNTFNAQFGEKTPIWVDDFLL